MFVKSKVSVCDFTGTTYSEPVDGADLVVCSAVGRYRYCPIMWAGPEYLEEQGINPVSYDTAVEILESEWEANGGFIDF
jgi:hypothetical protein